MDYIPENAYICILKKALLQPILWRTTLQQEIDLVEESDGMMTAFEMKWNPNKKVLFSKSFTEAYPVKETITITPENYMEYL